MVWLPSGPPSGSRSVFVLRPRKIGVLPEQRLLSPEIHRWRRRSCRTLSRKTTIDLGFGVGRLYIGREAASEVDLGPHTMWWRGPGGTLALGVAAHWPPSGSPSVFVLCPGKIGGSSFVSSNSENISCVAFLKHKNSRKQGTGTVASCQ
jgi:hypothetical protein